MTNAEKYKKEIEKIVKPDEQKLTTYADYEAECKRVQKIIDGSTRRNAGQWITYLHRLWKEMQEYRKNKEQAK